MLLELRASVRSVPVHRRVEVVPAKLSRASLTRLLRGSTEAEVTRDMK